jgi:hypothetical protein
VSITEAHEISGVVQADAQRFMGAARIALYMQAPVGVVAEVRARLKPLLSL